MGLDSVEIVMVWEERFGTEFTPQEMARMRTVRQVVEILEGKLEASATTEICLSMRAFHRFRQAFHNVLETPKREIRPSTPLEDLIPRLERKRRLGEVLDAADAGIALDLIYPTWALLSAAVPTLILSIAFFLWLGLRAWMWLICFPLLFLTGTGLLLWIMRAWRIEFPREVSTVKDLVHIYLAAQPKGRNSEGPVWSRELIRIHVRRILCEQMAIADTFSDDADFVKDLGIG